MVVISIKICSNGGHKYQVFFPNGGHKYQDCSNGSQSIRICSNDINEYHDVQKASPNKASAFSRDAH
jgi:hypothetical protein